MGITNKTLGITGSTGFIGTHLKRLLESKHISYVVFDGELENKRNVEKLFSRNRPFCIIHLAGRTSGSEAELMKANFETTKTILRSGCKYGLKKIIFASTGAVYGLPKHNTGSVETDPVAPNTAYAFSKSMVEVEIRKAHESNNIDYVILRFPSVYGPGNKKGVIYQLIHDIRKNKTATIYGNGKQTRQFLHVNDACEALLKAYGYSESAIFNIAPKKVYTLAGLIAYLKNRFSFKIKRESKNNDLIRMELNTKKAQRQLRFIPKYQTVQLSDI